MKIKKALAAKFFKTALAAVLLSLCAILPAAESSGCSQLRRDIRKIDLEISKTESLLRLDEALIAQACAPEFLAWSAKNLKEGLVKIEPEKNCFVEENNDEEKRSSF